jgi:SAM-dependent methyltransferase
MIVIERLYPNWRSLSVHESSPVLRGVSAKLHKQCPSYVMSQYDREIPFGSIHPYGYRSEDIESQTFEDECFDLVITQDVFEHLFKPDQAIKEISRTLRVGGAHVATVPLVQRNGASRRRASLGEDGEVIHHLEPQYHKSAAGDGVLVTIDWGYDIVRYITEQSGLVTTLYLIDDLWRGVRAEFIEVMVNQKVPALGGI